MKRNAVEQWLYLLTPAAAPLLLAAEEVGNAPSVAAIEKLRRDFDHEEVRLAIELLSARQVARRKFPNRMDILCDRSGAEQASSALAADWKAERFGNNAVVDLCCGIGGDAMSLAARGPTVGVDHSPERAAMCSHNAGIKTEIGDVTSIELNAPLVHIDPARRDEATGQRRWSLDMLEPGLEAIASVIKKVEGGAVKLGPGLARDAELPFGETSIEFLAEGNSIVQSIAWFGTLATPGVLRRASDVVARVTVEGVPERPMCFSSVGRFLLVPHVAVERAELMPTALGSIVAGELAPGLGILTCDAPTETHWFEAFEVLDVLSPRLSKVKSWLREHDAGRVVVRTRDQAVDADTWTRTLQGEGSTEIVLFVLRLGKKVVVIATHRSSSTP